MPGRTVYGPDASNEGRAVETCRRDSTTDSASGGTRDGRRDSKKGNAPSRSRKIPTAYLRSAAGYLLDRGVSLATAFIMMVAVARCYPTERVGQFTLAYTIVQTLLSTLTQGLEPYLIRTFVATPHEQRRQVVRAVSIHIALITVACVMVAAVAFSLSGALHTDVGVLLLALGVSVLVIPALAVESYLKAIERVELVGLYRTLVLLPGLAAKIGFAATGAPLLWICGLTAAEYWIIALIALAVTWRTFKHTAGTRKDTGNTQALSVVNRSGATFPGVLSVASAALLITLFMRSPNLMMPALSSFSDFAGFALAFQLVQLPAVAGAIALAAAYPRFVQLAQSDVPSAAHNAAQRLMSLAVLATYLVAGAFFLFGSHLLSAIFGARYEAAGSSLWVLALSLPVVLTGQVRGYIIYVNNRPGLHVVNALIGLVAIWALGYALIPHYAAVGAAIAYTLATVISGWLTSFLFDSTRAAGKMQFNAFLIHYPI